MISFIILTWNSERYLLKCFNSIIRKCAEEGIPLEAIIIDNGSQDGSIEIIKDFIDRYPNVFNLIALDSNRGTTYSRNLGMKQARGEYLCILDSDTEFGEGSLAALLGRLHDENNIGIIAPRLLLPDGSVQNSIKRFPTMLDKLFKIPRILMGINTKNVDFYENFPFIVESEVDSAISACWLFRKEILQQVGYLDEKIFYAPEDIDYSLRIWKAGLKIIYSPMLTVLHHTQQLTHNKPLSKISFKHLIGLLYYFNKHGGWVKRPTI